VNRPRFTWSLASGNIERLAAVRKLALPLQKGFATIPPKAEADSSPAVFATRPPKVRTEPIEDRSTPR